MKLHFFLSITLPLLLVWNCAMGDPGFGDGTARFSVYYSEPGTDEFTGIDKRVDEELVKIIDSAERKVYLSVYNFNKSSIVQAMLRAEQRNLEVKVVGDIDEFYTEGYQEMFHHNIDMSLGNASGIQHNKFAVIDDRLVFTGTGNLSNTDMIRNNNNWYIIESEKLAEIYTNEFLQMHNGLFASKKKQRFSDNKIIINNYPIELYFSPYMGNEAMDRLVELVEGATKSVHYMIFAYTHDELDAAMVKKARQNNIPVYGIHDSTFVVGVSEEAPKLYSSGFNNDGSLHTTGPFVRWDGNENTSIRNNPGHGGKMHCKTLIIDAGTPSAKLATGSFNWSTNAIDNNDENMFVIPNAKIANAIYEQFRQAWGISQDMNLRVQNRGHVAGVNDIIISEVGWAGSSDGSSINNGDDFIEIFNNTDEPIDLSHWSVQWGPNERKNIYPVPDNYNWYYANEQACSGHANFLVAKPNVICPRTTRIFYNKKPSAWAVTGSDEQYDYGPDGEIIKASTGGSLSTQQFKFSGTKNFSLSNAQFKVRLYDKAMNLIDEAGDGGPAPSGVADTTNNEIFTMERRGFDGPYISNPIIPYGATNKFNLTNLLSGNSPAAWFTHPSTQSYDCTKNLHSGSVFDDCLNAQSKSYTSAGYIYSAESAPVLKSVYLQSDNQLMLQFDANMVNCTGGLTISAGSISTIVPQTDKSKVLLTASATPFNNTGTRYSVTVTSGTGCNSATSISAQTKTAYFSGYSATLAGVVLNEVCFDGGSCTGGGKDFIELKVTTSGSLRGLKLYEYNSDNLQLLYEFGELYVSAGEFITVTTSNVTQGGEDTDLVALSPYDVTSQDNGLDGTDDALILTYCAVSENDTGCNSFTNKGIQSALLYSNRDGALESGMSKGSLTHFYNNLKNYWPISEKPIHTLNDRTIQRDGICTGLDTDSTENALYACSDTCKGLRRKPTGSLTGKVLFRCNVTGTFTKGTANLDW